MEIPQFGLYNARTHASQLTIVSEFARLIIPGHEVVVLGPVTLRDDEDQVGVGLLHIFVQAPEQVGRVDHPRDIDDDNVAQREGHEEGGLHRVVPVLERCVDGQQNEEDQVEDPVEPVDREITINAES